MSTEQMKQHQAPATHTPAGNKMTYTPPQMEVIKMDLEGSVMSASLTVSRVVVVGEAPPEAATPAEAITPRRVATWKT